MLLRRPFQAGHGYGTLVFALIKWIGFWDQSCPDRRISRPIKSFILMCICLLLSEFRPVSKRPLTGSKHAAAVYITLKTKRRNTTHLLPSPPSLFGASLYWISREGNPPHPHHLPKLPNMPFHLSSFSHPLICLSRVTTSICLSPLASVGDNNSVIHSCEGGGGGWAWGCTLKRRLFPRAHASHPPHFIGRSV